MTAVFSWLVALSAKASVLLVMALVADLALRRAPANARHAMWTATFVALLSLPILSALLPGLPLAVLGSVSRAPVERSAGAGGEATGAGATNRGPEVAGSVAIETVPAVVATGQPASMSMVSTFLDRGAVLADRLAVAAPAIASLLWAVGVVGALILVVVSFHRASRLISGARDLLDVAWRTDLRESRALVGIQEAVRLRESSLISTPMAGGFRRRVVLVPEVARGWSARRRHFVLLHELVHLAHRDPSRHLVARLALALHWPNPLAWLAAHRAIAAREEACDERVLALGVHPASYARELVELTALLRPQRHAGVAALPMIQRSLMEKRIVNILRDDRRPLRRPIVVALAMLAGVATLSVAAAVPQALPEPVVGLEGTSQVGDEPLPQGAERAQAAAAAMGVPVFPADSICVFGRDGYFSGFEASQMKKGGRVYAFYEQVGTRNGGWSFVRHANDRTVCMRTHGDVEMNPETGAVTVLGSGGKVSWETRDGVGVQRLEVRAGDDYAWSINGVARVFDFKGRAWYAAVQEAVALHWETSHIRRRAMTLDRQIAKLRMKRGLLRGRIWAARDEVSSMRERISVALEQASEMRGEISAIRAHANTMRAKLSRERSFMNSLRGQRMFSDDDELAQLTARIEQHRAKVMLMEDEIRRYNTEQQTGAIEELLNAHDFDGQVREIEREITAFDLAGKIARLEAEIESLDADANITRIQQERAALNAHERVERLQTELKPSVERLERLIAATR